MDTHSLTPEAQRLLSLLLGPPGGWRVKLLALLYQMVTPGSEPPVEAFVEELLHLPDVYETKGDLAGERSFRVGRREFLHLHGRVLHIILPREEKDAALAAGAAEPHPFAPRSGYVQFRLRDEPSLAEALRLARRAYGHAAARTRDR